MSAWDGTRWFFPGYAPRDPPPYLVHVDIEASVGTVPPAIVPWREGAHRVTDALLNLNRAPPAVSFGWVDWYGIYGQLALINGGSYGVEAGHLIFYFTAAGVNYDISLHAWASKERITGPGVTRVVRAPQPGPALPHVIATLKAIVGSALGR